MKILAIETSCDETSIAIVEAQDAKEIKTLSHVTRTQIDIHKQYGGVFPALAKREHARNLVPILQIALDESGLLIKEATPISAEQDAHLKELLNRETELYTQLKDLLATHSIGTLDALVVTQGPGLEPALWVGINFAKALQYILNIPLYPVNHMEGHLLSAYYTDEGIQKDVPLPSIALLVSGGHTEIVLVKKIGQYTRIGSTRDDASGEAFDKVARLLGLPYPGGPEISRLAKLHREKFPAESYEPVWKLPRPMLHSDDCDFSFSGLKTAVLYSVKDKELSEDDKESLARDFEDAVTEVLVYKTMKAVHEHNAQSVSAGGGVSGSKFLQVSLAQAAEKEGYQFFIPRAGTYTDNALMIAYAGLIGIAEKRPTPPVEDIVANGNWEITKV